MREESAMMFFMTTIVPVFLFTVGMAFGWSLHKDELVKAAGYERLQLGSHSYLCRVEVTK